MLWDVFCQVVDNYGDAGFCWRLARELHARGEQVRLWIDDARPLQWLAGADVQAAPAQLQGVQIVPWERASEAGCLDGQPIPDVLVEAFGCEVPHGYLAALQARAAAVSSGPHAWPRWLNLEYLSAQAYVERSHRLPSPVMAGPAAGQAKVFFYPGFTERTGGLLRESDLLDRRAQHGVPAWRRTLLAENGWPLGLAEAADWISLFAYEPACLTAWLAAWSDGDRPVHLLAAAGRSQAWLLQCWQALGWALPEVVAIGSDRGGTAHTGLRRLQQGKLSVQLLPYMPQPQFDQLLWSCDLNIVRGEESMVRALWAGRPLLWHIYPQHDGAHHAKLQAWLDALDIGGSWRAATLALNDGVGDAHVAIPPRSAHWRAWQPHAASVTAALAAMPELTGNLLAFAREPRRP